MAPDSAEGAGNSGCDPISCLEAPDRQEDWQSPLVLYCPKFRVPRTPVHPQPLLGRPLPHATRGSFLIWACALEGAGLAACARAGMCLPELG